MKKEVIFVLLDQFADWEGAFLASALTSGVAPDRTGKYDCKTMSPAGNPVRSIGGMTVLPDYDASSLPGDFAALVLVGGMQWQSEQARTVVPIVRRAVAQGIPVGAICNASAFLGAHGFLNEVRHTSNTLPVLKAWGGANYTGEKNYVEQDAVSDRGIVTANGSGYLEFTREMLLLLDADTPERIEAYYRFNKNGFCAFQHQ